MILVRVYFSDIPLLNIGHKTKLIEWAGNSLRLQQNNWVLPVLLRFHYLNWKMLQYSSSIVVLCTRMLHRPIAVMYRISKTKNLRMVKLSKTVKSMKNDGIWLAHRPSDRLQALNLRYRSRPTRCSDNGPSICHFLRKTSVRARPRFELSLMMESRLGRGVRGAVMIPL